MAHLEPLSEADACAYLSQFRLVDPAGRDSVKTAVAGASCWRLTSPRGSVVFALKCSRTVAHVSAAAGRSSASMTAQVLAAIERQARAQGLRLVRFQTVRRGLVRRAEALGYVLRAYLGAGCVMEKTLDDD